MTSIALVNHTIENTSMLLLLVNAILHFLFAGAVARDAGNLHKIGIKTTLVSATTWAFATLMGGVMTAAIYWFIHHAPFTKALTGAPYDSNRTPTH